MKKVAALCLACCLLLCGCASIFDGSYVSITPHQPQQDRPDSQMASAKNYSQLYQVLKNVIRSGATESLISVVDYYQPALEREVTSAVETVLAEDPIAAYAVNEISFEIGTNQGLPAVVVIVRYTHDRSEIQKILEVTQIGEIEEIISAELSRYSTGVVLHGEDIGSLDYEQLVEDFGGLHPETVMEVPEVIVNQYPKEGKTQVVELKFNYQHSRDVIREMQAKVEPIFEAAALHAGGGKDDRAKYTRLYALLMESFEIYTLETSITPAYSLLIYGVGDSKAFANVYGAMCRQAGLECITVSGTRMGEAWHWNMVKLGGNYYHLDLLASRRAGAFNLCSDAQMTGYVWDYSALPTGGME